MKFLKWIICILFAIFLASIVSFIIFQDVNSIIIGVTSGVLMFMCSLGYYMLNTEGNEFWREIEDIDQQKIFNDD